MTELDQLEMDLLAAADVWFSKGLHMKLQRLVAIARAGERYKTIAKELSRCGSEACAQVAQPRSGGLQVPPLRKTDFIA